MTVPASSFCAASYGPSPLIAAGLLPPIDRLCSLLAVTDSSRTDSALNLGTDMGVLPAADVGVLSLAVVPPGVP